MNKLKDFFENLETRERNILIAGLTFVFFFVLINFIAVPVYNYKKDLEVQIKFNVYQSTEIIALGEQYKKITGNLEKSFTYSKKNINIFSFLDALTRKTGIKDKVDYMKPSTESYENYTIEKVEIKISNINMKDLVSFIFSIESGSEKIRIKALKISRSDKSGTISSTIQTETINKNV